MPVNMDPNKRRRFSKTQKNDGELREATNPQGEGFGEETEEDREKALADAESKNLWDETEVIDMDNILPGSGNTY